MEPREVLVATLEDVKETDVPEALRVIAFSKVFDLRVGTVTPAPSPAGVHQPQGRRDAGGDPSDPLSAIAHRIGTSRDTVSEVFDVRDGTAELIIPPGKLPTATASATKEIALLVAGGHQAGEGEEWTPVDAIRDVCRDFKKLDSANFAKTVNSMQDVFNFRKEERKASVKLARPGWDTFGALVRRLGGES
jgi:hypothetical protein